MCVLNLYVCPHPTIYVSSCHYMCVLILLASQVLKRLQHPEAVVRKGVLQVIQMLYEPALLRLY